MQPTSKWMIAAVLFAASGITAYGSSHREALAILNEPCADNTDTYAWVSNATHDKLYLIMNFYPLHEPGQGNQGLRACNGYRYEFHIGKGASLKDEVVYRNAAGDEVGRRRFGSAPLDPSLGVARGGARPGWVRRKMARLISGAIAFRP